MEKIQTKLAKNVTMHFELEEMGIDLLRDDIKTAEFLELLISNESYTDAINLLSHSLPKREAVWWACICAKQQDDETKDELYDETLKIAEKWVYDPSEKNRRVAEFYAEKGKYETAAAWAAAAAFWSGDSIVAENEPKIAPDEYLYAHAVSGSILTSACMQDKDDTSDIFKKYIEHGINIANGGNG
ncbi:MAG: hypothetical protein KAQ67_12470 [Gammaproteobacteria bacterium]|nr:hypothetical protein [Gammaproteobacteria bacterium]